MTRPAFAGEQVATELKRLEEEERRAREASWDAKTHQQRLDASAAAERARLAVQAFRAEHSTWIPEG